jgi:hypothetical protein
VLTLSIEKTLLVLRAVAVCFLDRDWTISVTRRHELCLPVLHGTASQKTGKYCLGGHHLLLSMLKWNVCRMKQCGGHFSDSSYWYKRHKF